MQKIHMVQSSCGVILEDLLEMISTLLITVGYWHIQCTMIKYIRLRGQLRQGGFNLLDFHLLNFADNPPNDASY